MTGDVSCTGFADFRGTSAHHGTCSAFCEKNGLRCSDAWEDDEGPNSIGAGCPPKVRVGCERALQTQICKCVPKDQTPTEQPTAQRMIKPPDGYEVHPERCVYVQHETDLTGKTVASCALACDEATDVAGLGPCLGFEFYHNYLGKNQHTKPGDCHLIPGSQNMDGCPGLQNNLDYYRKKTAAPSLGPGKTYAPTRAPTPKPTPIAKPPIPSDQANSMCAPGYTLEPKWQERCYKALLSPSTGNKFTWLEAQQACIDDLQGATRTKFGHAGLATITNEFENDFVRDTIVRQPSIDHSLTMWSIGANDIGTEDLWKWSGETIDGRNPGVAWSNWAPGQPNDGQPDGSNGWVGHQDGSYMVMECSACRSTATKACGDCSDPTITGCDDCAKCNIGPGKTGRPCGSWNDWETSSPGNDGAVCSHRAVSESASSPCANGFELEPTNQQRCYKAVKWSPLKSNSWTKAQKACQTMDDTMKKGVGLASITSPEENAFVVNLLQKLGAVSSTTEFAASIGCTDDQEEGVFVWSGEGNRPVMYTNWAPGEPNQDHNRNENVCVIFGNDHHNHGKSPTGTWNDAEDTATTRAYVCSYRRACKEGWRLEPRHEKRCYKAVSMSDDTEWKTAQRRCRAMVPSKGSDMATITSQAENDFVKSLITENAFLGCNDIDEDRHWVWSGEGKWKRLLCTQPATGGGCAIAPGTTGKPAKNVYMNWHTARQCFPAHFFRLNALLCSTGSPQLWPGFSFLRSAMRSSDRGSRTRTTATRRTSARCTGRQTTTRGAPGTTFPTREGARPRRSMYVVIGTRATKATSSGLNRTPRTQTPSGRAGSVATSTSTRRRHGRRRAPRARATRGDAAPTWPR